MELNQQLEPSDPERHTTVKRVGGEVLRIVCMAGSAVVAYDAIKSGTLDFIPPTPLSHRDTFAAVSLAITSGGLAGTLVYDIGAKVLRKQN